MTPIPKTVVHCTTILNCQELRIARAPETTLLTLPSCSREAASKVSLNPQFLRFLTQNGSVTKLMGETSLRSRNISIPEATRRIYELFAVKFGKDTSWDARLEMFRTALGQDLPPEEYNHNIYSISIEPTDPTIDQPIYCKNSFDNESMAQYGKMYTKTKILGSSCPYEEFPKETHLVTGLLKPFPRFTADMTPEVSPDSPPSNVEQIPVSGITAKLSTIKPDSLRKRVKHIVTQFLLDSHAKSLYLITLQPAHTPDTPVQRLLFIKP